MHTTVATKHKDIHRAWHLIDAHGKILGRLATHIALLLIGKSKPYFVSSLDCGDHVVVINAERVALSGKKADQKLYERFSGYPGGRKVKTFREVLASDPGRILTEAVSGMLPKNSLRPRMLTRLHVFSGTTHPYQKEFHVNVQQKGKE